jgi:hypothetical protein
MGFFLLEDEVYQFFGPERVDGGHQNLRKIDITTSWLPFFWVAEFPVEMIGGNIEVENRIAIFVLRG